MAQTNFEKRIINLRPEVYDLIQGECEVRRNGGKGFSLTLNQIVLEYFEMRTPENVVVKIEDGGRGTGKPALTIDWNPEKEARENKKRASATVEEIASSQNTLLATTGKG